MAGGQHEDAAVESLARHGVGEALAHDRPIELAADLWCASGGTVYPRGQPAKSQGQRATGAPPAIFATGNVVFDSVSKKVAEEELNFLMATVLGLRATIAHAIMARGACKGFDGVAAYFQAPWRGAPEVPTTAKNAPRAGRRTADPS